MSNRLRHGPNPARINNFDGVEMQSADGNAWKLGRVEIKYLYKTRFIVILDFMTTQTEYARALAALGHDARLAIFRLLVKCGPDGLRVGEIGQHLDMAPSTLAHHLASLVDTGLVVQEKIGREVFNKAEYPAVVRLAEFLTSECCQGVTLGQKEDAA